MIKEIYNNYCKIFRSHWEKDAKIIYRKTPTYLENIERDLLFESMGIMASAAICRATIDLKLPDLSCINNKKKNEARALIMLICHEVLKEKNKYIGIDDLIETIINTSRVFVDVVRE